MNAPRAESVPALKVFDTPFGGSLNSRDIGSTRPGSVAENLRLEIAVCSARILDVSIFGFHFRMYP